MTLWAQELREETDALSATSYDLLPAHIKDREVAPKDKFARAMETHAGVQVFAGEAGERDELVAAGTAPRQLREQLGVGEEYLVRGNGVLGSDEMPTSPRWVPDEEGLEAKHMYTMRRVVTWLLVRRSSGDADGDDVEEQRVPYDAQVTGSLARRWVREEFGAGAELTPARGDDEQLGPGTFTVDLTRSDS